MTTPSSPDIATTPAFEPVAELAPGVPLGQKLRILGRTALAVTCASLALLSVEATEASAHSEFQMGTPITRDLAVNAPQPSASAAIIPPVPATEVGVATGSWDDDGLGYHTLFKDIATEGMSEVRLSFLGTSDQNYQEMQAEADSGLANDVEPVISLPVNMTPQQAAEATMHLPDVDQFVIGNEVNSPLFSNLTPSQYVDLLAHTTAAIHAVRPGVQTRGFALAYNYHPLPYLQAAIQYADSEYGDLQNITDEVDFHVYGSLAKDELYIPAVMQAIGPDMPAVIGEAGFILNDETHTGYDTPGQQALDELGLYTFVSQYSQLTVLDWFRYRANSLDPFKTANRALDGSPLAGYSAMQSALTGN